MIRQGRQVMIPVRERTIAAVTIKVWRHIGPVNEKQIRPVIPVDIHSTGAKAMIAAFPVVIATQARGIFYTREFDLRLRKHAQSRT